MQTGQRCAVEQKLESYSRSRIVDAHDRCSRVLKVVAEDLLGVAGLGLFHLVPASDSRFGIGVAGTDLAVGMESVARSSSNGQPILQWYRTIIPASAMPSLVMVSCTRRLEPPMSAVIVRRRSRFSPKTFACRTSPVTVRIPSTISERVTNRWHGTDPTVHWVFDALIDALRAKGVQPAGNEEATTERAQPFGAGGFVEGGVRYPGGRHPCDRHAAIRDLTDVERTIRVKFHLEAATGDETHAPRAAGGTLVWVNASMAGYLRETPTRLDNSAGEAPYTSVTDIWVISHPGEEPAGPPRVARLPGPKCLSNTRSSVGEVFLMTTPAEAALDDTKYSSLESCP